MTEMRFVVNKKNLLLLLPLSATVVCAEVFSPELLVDNRSSGTIQHYSAQSLLPAITQLLVSNPFLEKYASYVSVKLSPTHPVNTQMACLHSPHLSLLNNTGIKSRLTIQAECDYPNPWKQRIPIQLSIYYPVVTAQEPLQRGKPITEAQLSIKPMDILSLRDGFFDNTTPVLGQIPKQSIAPGHPLSQNNIEAPKLVKRGNFVSIVTHRPGFAIEAQGKALGDGALGAKIKVENMESKRIIEGIVTGPEKIELFL